MGVECEDYPFLNHFEKLSLNNLNNLKVENNHLVQQNNNLLVKTDNLETTNQELAQEVKELITSLYAMQTQNNQLRSLLNQKQSSVNISEFLSKNKELLLIIGGVSIVGYLLFTKK